MPPTIGGIGIDPQGQTLVVDITTAGGVEATAYSDEAGTTAHVFPVTVSSRTRFYFATSGQYVVSAKRNDLEIAGPSGQALSVGIEQGTFQWISPSVDAPGPEEVAQSNVAGGIDSGEVVTIAQPLVDQHADRRAGAAVGTTGSAHGAVTGAGKVAVLVTPAGTGQFIFVANESLPPAGVNLGDLWSVAPDGTF